MNTFNVTQLTLVNTGVCNNITGDTYSITALFSGGGGGAGAAAAFFTLPQRHVTPLCASKQNGSYRHIGNLEIGFTMLRLSQMAENAKEGKHY